MATEAPLQDLLEEATCSICLDFFQDPVLIPECGHNFCLGCLTRSWGASESEASCPQCRQPFAPRSVFANRQLARKWPGDAAAIRRRKEAASARSTRSPSSSFVRTTRPSSALSATDPKSTRATRCSLRRRLSRNTRSRLGIA
ncbi:zinc finger protein RFP-like [Thamnophis elegans]|uniref:zinc finger protein RFP-like n=1 Tax=Thamnophis elegans TaxID=35005 RepID=UPI0013779750|nr:zinc finger protein RFP-like [Thamnophis elegans]